jgi:hypothetical protein
MCLVASRNILLALDLQRIQSPILGAFLLQNARVPIMLNVAKMAGFTGFGLGGATRFARLEPGPHRPQNGMR